MFDIEVDTERAGKVLALAKVLTEARGKAIVIPAAYPNTGPKSTLIFSGLIVRIDDLGDSRYIGLINGDTIKTTLTIEEIQSQI